MKHVRSNKWSISFFIPFTHLNKSDVTKTSYVPVFILLIALLRLVFILSLFIIGEEVW